MDVRSAELTKYAANAMLATRISFMNELANLAERLGADIEAVRQGIGSDPRIGYHFLYPGVGYGGSCFPEGREGAAVHRATSAGTPLKVLGAVEAANEAQKHVLVDKIVARFGDDLSRPPLRAVGTRVQAQHRRHARGAVARDHRRAARARRARRRLRSGRDGRGAARPRRPSRACRSPRSPLAACEGADALVVVTEWKEFRSPDFDALQPALTHAADLRRPQSVRARRRARRRLRVFFDRPASERMTARRARFSTMARPRRGGARAGRRRRDARPLLVRRRRAHLARGAGAGRQDRAHRGASRRRRQRRAQRRRAGRARDAAVGDRRRRAGATRCCACSPRERISTSFLRDAALTTTVKLRVIGRQQQLLRIDFETAPSHELLAANLADVRPRCSPTPTRSCCPTTARAGSRTSRR